MKKKKKKNKNLKKIEFFYLSKIIFISNVLLFLSSFGQVQPNCFRRKGIGQF